MFTYPRTNVIESDEGFEVEIAGPSRVRYAERGRRMEIESELLLGPEPLVLYASSIRGWFPPHQHETITAVNRDRIVDNIRRAIRSKGLEIKVD